MAPLLHLPWARRSSYTPTLRHPFVKKRPETLYPGLLSSLSLVTHLGQSASRRESAILPQRLPDERVLRHELVRTDERVERPRCVLSPDVDNVDVHHALVHLVERCLEGLRRQTRKSRRGGVSPRGSRQYLNNSIRQYTSYIPHEWGTRLPV